MTRMANLSESLYNLPTERLRALVERRSVEPKKLALMPNKRNLVQLLTQELVRGTSLNAAIVQCNARQLRLLQLLTLCEADSKSVIAWRKIETVAGGAGLRETLEKIVETLEDWGLAFRVEGGVFFPEAVRVQTPVSLPDRHTLLKCLNSYDAQAIKRIVRKLELTPPGETKPINTEAIYDHLMTNSPGLQLKCPLDSEEVAALEHLVSLGGAAPAMEVASSLYDATDDFFRYDWQNRWKFGQERNAIDRLLARGIIHVVWQGYGYNLFVVIPGDLLRVLTGGNENAFWTGPPVQPTVLETPPTQTADSPALNRDVVGLLGFLAANEALRTGSGVIHKTSLKNIARTLRLPDERYATFLYALCREAKLIATQGDRQVYALTPKGSSWLHWDSLAQTRTLFEAWRNGTTWGEMYSEPLYKEGSYRAKDAMLRLRHTALSVLKECDPTPWYDLNSLTDTLTFRAPLMLTAGTMGPDLVPSPAAFVRLLVGECLAWLGAVTLGRTEAAPEPPAAPDAKTAQKRVVKSKGRLITKEVESELKPSLPDAAAFRLTPLGGYLLGLSGASAPEMEPREDKFIVQANGEIFIPPYLEPVLLYRLLTLTDTPTKGAISNTVALTRDAIRRSLDSGESAREILSFLQAHSRTGIPQNVEYLINEVGSKHGHIHIGTAQMYVQVDSPILLQELQARREIKPYFVRALSDTIALLKADDPDKLLRELRKAGYMPVSDEASPRTTLKASLRYAPPPEENSDEAEPVKPGRRALKTDTALDWERIAQEDNKPYTTEKPRPPQKDLAMPEGATTNEALKRFMLSQAVLNHKQAEIGYQESAETGIVSTLVEPVSLQGDSLNANIPNSDQSFSYLVSRIVWVRATRKPFGTPEF